MNHTEVAGVEDTRIPDDWEVKKSRGKNYEH